MAHSQTGPPSLDAAEFKIVWLFPDAEEVFSRNILLIFIALNFLGAPTGLGVAAGGTTARRVVLADSGGTVDAISEDSSEVVGGWFTAGGSEAS